MSRAVAVLLVLVAVSVQGQTAHTQHNGPFGFWRGEPISELKKLGAMPAPGHEGIWTMKTAPKSHPGFETYNLLVSEKYGLCRVSAIGKDISTNSYGTALTSQYEAIVEGISAKYGQGENVDHLNAGSIWNEPNDFMMALYKEDRSMATFWEHLDTLKTDGVLTIMAKGKSLHPSTGYITLVFDFVEADKCIDELTAKRNSVF